MLSAVQLRQIVSGERKGSLAAAVRVVSSVLEIPYRWVVEWRNARFDAGRAAVTKVDGVVISIGNLTVGGTGKTPFVAWMAEWFRKRGMRVAIVSRGYGSRRGEPNDEALELAARLPHVPHLQNANRVAGGPRGLPEEPGGGVVFGDGFLPLRGS